MPTQSKAAVIDEITERFQNSSAAVLTEYRGLTVAQLTQLRRSLGAGSSYAVVKNTLTKRAADSVGYSDLAGAMKGNLTKAAGLFQAPLSQMARLAAALQEKKAADTPAADAPTAAYDAAEAPATEAPVASADDDTAAADTTPETAAQATEDVAADAASDD